MNLAEMIQVSFPVITVSAQGGAGITWAEHAPHLGKTAWWNDWWSVLQGEHPLQLLAR